MSLVWDIQGKSDIRGLIGKKEIICDRCGSRLFAEVWFVKETTTGKTWAVGSGCVKILTGRSVSQLQREKAEAELGAIQDAENLRRCRAYLAWAEVHDAELAFVDEHIARIQEAADRWYAAQHGIGDRTSPPSAEWWEKLRTKAQALGLWTEAELAAVRREMALDHDAQLPAAKSKVTFAGTVGKVYLGETQHGTGRWVLNHWKLSLTVNVGGLAYYVNVEEGTRLAEDLAQDFGFKIERNVRRDGYHGDASEKLMGRTVAFTGTVKGTAQTGGKVYITRAAIAKKEA